MKHGVESNLWKYLLLLICNKRTYMSILGVYLLTIPNTTATTLGLMFTIGGIFGFVAEIPSGFLSDKLGHTRAIVLSRILYVFSTGCFLIGLNVWWFFAGIALMNIGHAFYSGTGAAFIHETLRALGRDDEYASVMGKMRAAGFAIPIVFIVLVPLLVNISYTAAFILPLITDIIGLLVALTFVKPPVSQQTINEISNTSFKEVVKEGRRYNIFAYMFLMGLVTAAMMTVGSFKDVYQQILGVPIIYFGVFWAASRVIVSLLLFSNGWIKKHFSFHQILCTEYIAALLLIGSFFFTKSPIAVVALFIFISALPWSFGEVKKHYLLDAMKNSNFKATLLSFDWFFVSIIRTVIVLYIGWLGTQYSFPFAFIVLALLLLLFGSIGWWWVYRKPIT